MREVFTVTLNTPGSDAGYGLGVVASAAVTIEEGVCDRTPQVGDEIVQQAGVGSWSVGDGVLPAAMAADAQVQVIRGLPRR